MGYQLFMFAHLPLFGMLFWALMGQENPTSWIQGLNVFFIIHLIVHIFYLRHPKNEFKDWMSWLWIIGAAFFGGIDLFFHGLT